MKEKKAIEDVLKDETLYVITETELISVLNTLAGMPYDQVAEIITFLQQLSKITLNEEVEEYTSDS